MLGKNTEYLMNQYTRSEDKRYPKFRAASHDDLQHLLGFLWEEFLQAETRIAALEKWKEESNA